MVFGFMPRSSLRSRTEIFLLSLTWSAGIEIYIVVRKAIDAVGDCFETQFYRRLRLADFVASSLFLSLVGCKVGRLKSFIYSM